MMHEIMKRQIMKFENGNVIPGSHTNGMSGIDMTNEYRIAVKREDRNFALAIFIEKNLNATTKLARKYDRHRTEHTKKFIMCILCANKNITTPFCDTDTNYQWLEHMQNVLAF